MLGDIQLSTMGIFHRLYSGSGPKTMQSYVCKNIQLSTLSNFHRLERFRAKHDVVVCFEIYTYLLCVIFTVQRGSGQKTTQSYVLKYIVIYSEYFFIDQRGSGPKTTQSYIGNIQLSTLSFFNRLERFRAKNDIVVYIVYSLQYIQLLLL